MNEVAKKVKALSLKRSKIMEILHTYILIRFNLFVIEIIKKKHFGISPVSQLSELSNDLPVLICAIFD